MFSHDMADGKYKDLAKRAESDKVLREKAFKIASNPNYDGYQRGLASMVYMFFNKRVATLANKYMPNELQIPNKLHKLIIKKFKRRKVCSSFKDNICGVALADM